MRVGIPIPSPIAKAITSPLESPEEPVPDVPAGLVGLVGAVAGVSTLQLEVSLDWLENCPYYQQEL
jgi:hypothetical protein